MMKLIIVLLLVSFSACRKLSEAENCERIEKCGGQALETPHTDNKKPTHLEFPVDKWLVKVAVKAPDVNDLTRTIVYPEHALGSFISPRHIVTSSQPVIAEDYKWRMDVNKTVVFEQYSGAENGNLTTNLEFPEEFMFSLVVTRNVSDGSMDHVNLPKVKKASLLHIPDHSEFRKMYSMMLIELESDVPGMQYPCLANGTLWMDKHVGPDGDGKLDFQEYVDIYGFNGDNRSALDYRHIEMKQFENKTHYGRINVDNYGYQVLYDRGGPMAKTLNDKVTILAIGASPGLEKESSDFTYFLEIRSMYEDVCKYTGICDSACDTTTTVPPTTTRTPPHPTNVRPGDDDDGTVDGQPYEEEEVEEVTTKLPARFVICQEDCFSGTHQNSIIFAFLCICFMAFFMIV